MSENQEIVCEIYNCPKNYLTLAMNGLDVLKINPETGVAKYFDETSIEENGETKINMKLIRSNHEQK